MRIVLAGLAALSLAAAVQADPIETRQEGFKAFKQAMGGMKKMLDGKTAFSQAEFQKFALSLQDASKRQWSDIDARFPVGSDQGETAVRAEVWSDWAGFEAAADKNRQAVDALVAVAGSSDPAVLKKAMGGVGMSCKGCHDIFKKD